VAPLLVLPGRSAGVSNPLTGAADVAPWPIREARMGAELNPAQRLHALGQSLWLDSINRVMLRTGELARYVRELAVTGLTSNPTILGHAMAAGSDYDSSLTRLAGEGVTGAQDLVYALALEDLAEAAALFRPEWEQSGGVDGYVSLEVPPDVAYDAAATVALARRLHEQAGFPNLLVKIPGTPQGLTAMEEAITAGIGVNVTLLFSDTHYLRTADAYLRALQRRRDAGLDLAVPSVASVFISRWDSAADPLLPPTLHGRLGLAMAQKTYSSHLQLLSDKRWQVLAEAGARPQRVLWASTSTKNPDFPDTYYLGGLAAPNTIDTVPEKTLLAFADHGNPDERLEPDYAAAERAISAVADAGVDADALAEHLQRQGAGAFSADWAALLTAIEQKAHELKPEASQ
jgi:transaldolase